MNKLLIVIFFVILISWPLGVFAHQPRIVDSEKINVTKPEVSKAYYAKLSGKPHTYIISVNSAIDLYVNVFSLINRGTKKILRLKFLGVISHWECLVRVKSIGRNFLNHLGRVCIGKALN